MKIDWRSFTKKFVKEDDHFPFGIRFYDAPQGGGKSLSMVHDALELNREYPDMVLISNIFISGIKLQYNFQSVDDLIRLLEMSQSHNHTLVIIDEALSYFAENGGIDPALMSSITQNRKCRRFIMLATQKFKRVNNRLRDFSLETCVCRNFGRFQINCVRDDTRLAWDKDEMDFVGPVKYYSIFKRNKELFSCYDTFASISLDKNINTTSLLSPAQPPPPTAVGAGVYEIKVRRRK